MKNWSWLPALLILTAVFGGLATLEFGFPCESKPFLDFVAQFGVLFGATFGIFGAYWTARKRASEEKKLEIHNVARAMSNNFLFTADVLIDACKDLYKHTGETEDIIKIVQNPYFQSPGSEPKDETGRKIFAYNICTFQNSDFFFLFQNEAKIFANETFDKISLAFYILSYFNIKNLEFTLTMMKLQKFDYGQSLKNREKCLVALHDAAEILKKNYAPDAKEPSDDLSKVVAHHRKQSRQT